MTPEDRDAIVGFFDRLRVLRSERDPEAEKLIHDLMEQYPHTKYYVTQMAFFLEHAQAESQNRIRELEYALEQQRGGGLLGSLFRGGRATPPPAPIHAPGYRADMFQQPGGFLGGAAGTVMAIAGGFLLGSLLGSLFAPPGEAAAPPAEEPAMGDEDAYEGDGGDESW
jgi:hypothetical protein